VKNKVAFEDRGLDDLPFPARDSLTDIGKGMHASLQAADALIALSPLVLHNTWHLQTPREVSFGLECS